MKRLIKNFLSLSLLQGTNFILPLVVIPYLIKVIGIEKFGVVSFAQVLSLYLVIISEYGFNLSATKEVSDNKNDWAYLERLYNTVLTTRLLLSICGFGLLATIAYILPSLRKDYLLYILSSTMFFGQSLVPVWFFLGVEKMKYITYFNFISKVVLTLSTFFLIKEPDDYIYTNMLHGVGSIIAGIFSFYIVKKKYQFKFKVSNLSEVWAKLNSSFPIFISNFATNIYLNINIIILQLFCSEAIVGMYSVAEKVFTALKHLISVVFQSVYPFACKLKLESEQKFITFFARFSYFLALVFFVIGSLLYYFSDLIILLLAGKEIEESITFLRLLSFVPVIIAFSIPPYQASLIYNHNNLFSKIMISGSVLNVVTNLILTKLLGPYGTIITIYLTELFIMACLSYLIITKEKFNFFSVKSLYSGLRA